MKLRNVMLGCIATALTGCSITPMPLYKGEVLKDKEVAIYYPYNTPSQVSPYQIFTITLNDFNYENAGAFGFIPASGRITSILPGSQSVKISFVESDHPLMFTNNTAKVYMGYYNLTFEAKKGMIYFPVFNSNNKGSDLTSEMCIGEVSQKKGAGAVNNTSQYIACAKPTVVPVTATCTSWTHQGVADSCKHKL